MCGNGLKSRIIICGIVGVLSACGGGGNPMPSVTISSPTQATTINLGQAVNLNWTSAYATACTGSMSSSMGGMFTGSQPMSGSVAVAPVATGTVTYTVTCTGAGGTGSAQSAVVTVNPNILSTLTKITTIGLGVDQASGETNPYGLTIAPVTSGPITAGDLIICNFGINATTGQQAIGTTIVGLHPSASANAGGNPYRIAQSSSLQGCDALTTLADGSIIAAGFASSQNALVTPAGVVSTPFSSETFNGPWGAAYAAANGQNPAAVYVSNYDGSIDRLALNGDALSAFAKIAAGFCGSGSPGGIYAPSGLTYDPTIDTLYVVDTSSYSVVAFSKVSSIGDGGVAVTGQCPTGSNITYPTPKPTFGGPSASSVRVIANGAPLFAPISAALLADGDLIVGNGDLGAPSSQTPNLAVEVSPWLGVVGQPIQLDKTNPPGALFGIAATTDSQKNQLIYFNDDSAAPNTVNLLSK